MGDSGCLILILLTGLYILYLISANREEDYNVYDFIQGCSDGCNQNVKDVSRASPSCLTSCLDSKCSYACNHDNDCTLNCMEQNME